MEVLEGTIERITFYSQENGYMIAKFLPINSKEEITVVGYLNDVSAGETLRLGGVWVDHERYGRQLKVESFSLLMPATLRGIEKYLGSGLIKGVGPLTAKRLVEKFGLGTIDVIENHPEKLSRVHGISKGRAEKITRAWEEQKAVKEIMIFLQGHGITPGLAAKIYKHYGDQAIKAVRMDPFQLARDLFGVGFKTADRVACNLGIAKDDLRRLREGIRYVLSCATSEGHVFLPKQQLLEKSAEILQVSQEPVASAIEDLKTGGSLHFEDTGEIYLLPLYYAEQGVVMYLESLLSKPSALGFDNYNFFERFEILKNIHGFTLSSNQQEAVKKALQNKVTILTGGPGTGKTTTIKAITDLLRKKLCTVLLAAPTGRAAKRLTEATGIEAKTIHRLLEFTPQSSSFTRNQDKPLSADMVIIDEASMLDITLMHNLLKAVPSTAQLLLVGDVDQLPSVGPGNVLRDLIASGRIETVYLKELFRRDEKSLISYNAHRINAGLFPVHSKKAEDYFFIEEDDPLKVREIIVEMVSRRIPNKFSFDPLGDVQVIAPMHRGEIGVERLNSVLGEVLNPPAKNLVEYSAGTRFFRTGDKVMQIINNYQKSVFNGDLGRIISIDPEEQTVLVQFSSNFDMVVEYDFSELDELVRGYAISVHKSQGSEYSAVVMPLLTQHYLMLQRNLLYTAVTRAKKLVVLIGSSKALGIAIKNNKITERFSLLKERLTSSNKLLTNC